jgi:hypothetical protein
MRQQNRQQNSNFAGSGPAGSCDRITQQEQQQQIVEKILKELDEKLQTKNDEIRILFLKISKVEYLSKACACRDLADDSTLQVSSLHYKAALLLDEIDRVNLELTNIEYANRTLVEVEETLSTERKQGEVAEKKLTH